MATLEELRAQIGDRNDDLLARIEAFLQETGETGLPQLQDLTREKEELLEGIERDKEEGDALLHRINEDPDAPNVFRVGARVLRFEDFMGRVTDYVQSELPQRIERAVNEAGGGQFDEETVNAMREMRVKRQEELRKIGVLQQRTSKRAKEMREGPRIEPGELGAKSRIAKGAMDGMDEETQRTLESAEKAKKKKETLLRRVKDLRHEKCKLQAELLEEKHKNEKAMNALKARIRQAELANTRDIRLCQQLNTGNAALTTNANILLGQLNVEHYGVAGAPNERALLTMIKEGPKGPRPGEENGDGQNVNFNPNDLWRELFEKKTVKSPSGEQHVSPSFRELSRRQSVASVASGKQAGSQRNRDSIVRSEVDQSRDGNQSASRVQSVKAESVKDR